MGKRPVKKVKQPLVFSHRPIGPVELAKLNTTISSIDWRDILTDGQVSDCYDIFITHFKRILDECAPIKETVIPYRSLIREPWMTTGLMKSSRKRTLLYRKTIGKDKESNAYKRCIAYRNIYNNIKHREKEAYYQALLQKYNNDIRKTWKVLNTITGRVSSISETCMVNGVESTDKTIIANEFCSYFTTIGKQYAEAIPKSNKNPSHYLGNKPNASTMYLFPHTNADEISKIIKSFQTKKSTGDDGISMQLLKQLCQSCSSPIAMIINMSLDQGIVPDAMKLAKVIPIFKAKSSLLIITDQYHCHQTYPRCWKKVVHKRLYSFLTRCDILCDKQYGFRLNRFIIDAVTDLTQWRIQGGAGGARPPLPKKI